ncbi:hypothetical protein Q4610_14205 [Sphingobium sp. HBC34]|uniref:Uncharacterized protein n=1 Tax=Sphingobium cyanobacteriorum TaxID=3063954 RepID=A0ABT8ZQG8_9SPHN|nr:hypothetical protein [Sphingobium sp. HBC34]MDO7836199.1 hypothetical protein [Sphingobium sp. HBC34]
MGLANSRTTGDHNYTVVPGRQVMEHLSNIYFLARPHGGAP